MRVARMTPAEARAALKEAGHTQASLRRLLVEIGDHRPDETIRRSIGTALAVSRRDIPWYMAAILRLLKKMSESEKKMSESENKT